MTAETAIARLKERLATRCFGGDDDNLAVEILLKELDRLKPLREVFVLVGPVGPAAVHSSQASAIEDQRKRNSRKRDGGINPRYSVEGWLVQR